MKHVRAEMKNCVSEDYANKNAVINNKIFKCQQIRIKPCYILRLVKIKKRGGGEWEPN